MGAPTLSPNDETSSSSKSVLRKAAEQKQRDAPKPLINAVLGSNFADRPLVKRLNWVHIALLGATPLLALYGLFTTPLNVKTLVFAVVYYFITGLGITAGECLWGTGCGRAWLGRLVTMRRSFPVVCVR